MRSFAKINPSQNGEIILPFTDVRKSIMIQSQNLISQICLLLLFRENKIIAKFSEFTVHVKLFERVCIRSNIKS